MINNSATATARRASAIVSEYLASNAKPANLTIRLSAYFTDQAAPVAIAARLGLVTSTVTTRGDATCPAYKQGGFCGDCRACWNDSVANTSYPKHGRVKVTSGKGKGKSKGWTAATIAKLAARGAKYRAELAALEILIAARVARGEAPFRTKAEARLYVGGLSSPSKMPSYGWSISATKCRKGMFLAPIAGSVCNGCYALGNFYGMPDTIHAMERRFSRIGAKHFVDAFVFLMQGEAYFRWFDSGDLQSVAMLADIAEIARRCPHVKFWLPTKEYTASAEPVAATPAMPWGLTA